MDEAEDLFSFINGEILVKNEKVFILRHSKGTVHLLGCHHNRENYAEAVEELIRIVKPHIVAVELCRTNLERYNSLKQTNGEEIEEHTPKYTHMDVIPGRLKDRAIGEELLLGLLVESIKYDRNCGYRSRLKRFSLRYPNGQKYRVRPKKFHHMVIGKEMTVPFADFTWVLEKANSKYLVNKRVKYKIMLADKPVEETFCSIASALSEEERSIVQIYRANFLKLFVEFSTSKSIMMNMLEKNGRLYDAILKERDEYMATSVRRALDDAKTQRNELARVVGVFGKNHIPGIMRHWNKVIWKPRKPKPTAKVRSRRRLL